MKRGTTDPDEPSTFPNLTIAKRGLVFDDVRMFLSDSMAYAWTTNSARRLSSHHIVGRTALSVEIRITLETPVLIEARHITSVEKTLFDKPARGCFN